MVQKQIGISVNAEDLAYLKDNKLGLKTATFAGLLLHDAIERRRDDEIIEMLHDLPSNMQNLAYRAYLREIDKTVTSREDAIHLYGSEALATRALPHLFK